MSVTLESCFKPIPSAGVMLGKLPIRNKDVLGLFLFTVPQIATTANCLYHGHLAHEVMLTRDGSTLWYIDASERFVAWHDDGKVYIQHGPNDAHIEAYSLDILRRMLWDTLTKDIPALAAGEDFLKLVVADYDRAIYQINGLKLNERAYYIKYGPFGVEVNSAIITMHDGRAIDSDTAVVFRQKLCHTNVSLGTHGNFKYNAFVIDTHIHAATLVDDLLAVTEDNPSIVMKAQ